MGKMTILQKLFIKYGEEGARILAFAGAMNQPYPKL